MINLTTAIEYALDGTAILFTGSGFSYGCTNNLPAPDNKFPLGSKLRDMLALDLKMKTELDLKTVSQYYISKLGADNLANRLKDIFTLKDATQDQKEIMSIPWKRVYTTNYDLVAEAMSAKNGRSLETLTLSSEYYNPQNCKACIHLNGSITNLTPNTLMNEFKLTDSSYDAEVLDGKQWFEFMKRDFESAKIIFVVGFSKTQDLDISRILARPVYSGKVIFINKPGMDEIEKSILEPVGKVYDIGLTNFAQEIAKAKCTYVPSPTGTLPMESFVHENMKPSAAERAVFDELTNFYYKGEVSDNIFKKETTGEYAYVVYRKALDVFLQRLNDKKAFIAVSRLGGGKSIFCRLIREELRKFDVDVFTYVKDGVDIDAEIAAICNGTAVSVTKGRKRSVVIIDDYNAHMNVIAKFSDYSTEKITFLLTTRRSNNESNYLSLQRTLNLKAENVKLLLLTNMKRTETEMFAAKLRNNDLLPSKYKLMSANDLNDYFHRECKDSLMNIVLALFNSSSIRESLKDLLEKIIEEDETTSKLCILGLATSVLNLHLSYSDMLELLNVDYLRITLNPQSSALGEIFDAEDDKFKVSSSIIAKAMMEGIVPLQKLMEVLEIVVKKADEISPVINSSAMTSYRTDKYTELIKAILSHRNFERYIQEDRTNIHAIRKFYNSVRATRFCKQNPFYWEQFAIIYQEAKDFVAAKQCLENADAVAAKISGFVPFQISTIRGDVVLDETLTLLNAGGIDAAKCIDNILEAHKHFMKHYSHPENEHIRVFSNARKYTNIYDKIRDNLDRRGLSIYIEKVTEIIANIAKYKIEIVNYNVKLVEEIENEFLSSLDDAKSRLKKI